MTPQRAIGIRELRNGLNRYVDDVAAGAEIVITVRGRPVARLEPIERDDPLEELRRRGLVREPETAATRSDRRRRVKPSTPVADLVRGQRR